MHCNHQSHVGVHAQNGFYEKVIGEVSQVAWMQKGYIPPRNSLRDEMRRGSVGNLHYSEQPYTVIEAALVQWP